MPQIDLVLAAELLVVLLLVATLEKPSPHVTTAEPPQDGPTPPAAWTVETDRHAQRILRLEGRRSAASARLF